MSEVYNVISKAKEMGFQAEIFMAELREIQIKRERQYQNMSILDRGYGLRVIKDKKMGFAYSNNPDGLLELAIESFKASKEDPYNVLPSPEKVQKMNLKFFDVDEVSDKLKELLYFGNELKELVNVVSEYYEAINVKIKVVSTEGVDVEEERSLASISLSYNVKSDKEISPEIYEYVFNREFKLDLESLKDRVIKMKEIYSKERIKLEKPSQEAVLTTKALSELLSPLFTHAISLENYYRGKSVLKEGEVVNEIVSIKDNPLIQTAPYSRSFDGEGLPSKVNQLIDGGRVVRFLSNTYWSLKANKENTHSAGRNYSILPTISASILDIDVKEKSENEGIVIDQVQGVHTSNFDTGEFSVNVPIAWSEREGKAYKELTLTGNLKSLLSGIQGGIGKKEINWNVYSQWLKIKGVNVS